MASTATEWQSGQAPTPFWRRIPRFFLFPMQPAALARIAAAAVAVAAVAASGWWILMVVAILGALVFISRFGFVVIERSAQGYLRIADYPRHLEASSPYRPYKLFLIYVIAGTAVGFLEGLTGAAAVGLLANLAVSLLIPAATMQLALTDSLRQSINPLKLLDIALKIGAPYLLLCAFLFLLQMSTLVALATFAPLFAASVWALAGMLAFIVAYFTLITCAMTGYVMYQYAEPLELAVLGPGDSSRRAAGSRIDTAASARRALIGSMVAAGEIREAIDLVSDDLRERPSDLSLHGRLHKLLLMEGSAARIEGHAERYIDLLVKSGNVREALPIVEDSLKHNADWEPRKLELVAPLARAALDAGKPQLAGQLIGDFDRKHRMHPEVPQVQLVGALLALHGGDREQAQRQLESLIAQHAQHAAANEARRHLQSLARFASAARPAAPRA